MDILEIHSHRRKRLEDLIKSKYGDSKKLFCQQATIGDDSTISESRLAQLLSMSYRGGQGFGEVAARNLENRLGLPDMYFDFGLIKEEIEFNALTIKVAKAFQGLKTQEERNKALGALGLFGDVVIANEENDVVLTPTLDRKNAERQFTRDREELIIKKKA